MTVRLDSSDETINWQTWIPFTLTVNTNGTPTIVTNLPDRLRPPFVAMLLLEFVACRFVPKSRKS